MILLPLVQVSRNFGYTQQDIGNQLKNLNWRQVTNVGIVAISCLLRLEFDNNLRLFSKK